MITKINQVARLFIAIAVVLLATSAIAMIIRFTITLEDDVLPYEKRLVGVALLTLLLGFAILVLANIKSIFKGIIDTIKNGF